MPDVDLEVEIYEKTVKAVYGDTEFAFYAHAIHTANDVENSYRVRGAIRVHGFDSEISFEEVVGYDNMQNEETLTDLAILELLNEEV